MALQERNRSLKTVAQQATDNNTLRERFQELVMFGMERVRRMQVSRR